MNGVLSIQSHVVHGYVGNKASTFPLQLLGFEVDPINTVQFSNHTGYKNGWTGNSVEPMTLLELYEGLRKNDIAEYSYFLSGYIKDENSLEAISNIFMDLKAKNPSLTYVCDPVLGDNGKLYVPEELVNVYKELIIPLANIITPNQFEAELLSGIPLTCENSVVEITNIFHRLDIEIAVITSCSINNNDKLACYVSYLKPNSEDGKNHVIIKAEFPVIKHIFVGTGDLFTALFLAWYYKLSQNDLVSVVEKVLSTVQTILKTTVKHFQDNQKTINVDNDAKYLELKIIESKNVIENPPDLIKAHIMYDKLFKIL